MGKRKNHFSILSKKDLKKIKKIKINGNKTVYFDTISTDLNNLNLQSSLTYWRLKNYKSGESVRTVRQDDRQTWPRQRLVDR